VAQPDTSYGGTYADRLRGMRFWLPLIALLSATTLAAVLFSRTHQPSVTSHPPPTASIARADPALRGLLDELQRAQVFCGNPRIVSPDQVRCLFGAATAPISLRTFPSHAASQQALRTVERDAAAAFARTGAVTWAATNGAWVASGIWSSTGVYAAGGTGDALAAQAVSQHLRGCLELLPKQAGSCAF
jgi:hypothetical protein